MKDAIILVFANKQDLAEGIHLRFFFYAFSLFCVYILRVVN